MSALLSLIFAFPIFSLALRIFFESVEANGGRHAPPPSPPTTAVETAKNADDDADVCAETERGRAPATAVFARSLL